MLLYQKKSWYSLLAPWGVVRALWRNRALIRQFTWRNIELRHKGSLLGILWTVLNPLLVLSVYSFVFVWIFDGRFGMAQTETKWDYAIAIFLGLTISQLFLETLTSAPLVIISNVNYVKKVVFPLEVLPISLLGASLFHCVVSLCLVLLAVATFGDGLTVTALWLPIILFPVLLMSAGVAWFAAGIGVFLRDLNFVTQFLNLLLMFLSGVFYPPSRIPEAFSFLRANPLLVALDASRNAVLWSVAPSAGATLYLYATGVLAFLCGYFAFAKLRPAFADVI